MTREAAPPLCVLLALGLVCGVTTRTAAQSAIAIRAEDGGVVLADRYGSGDRGVVLAHGGRFDRTSWKPQALVLAGMGFRVIAIDFRAAVEARKGRETPCLYDAVCLAKDVVAAVRHLSRTGAKTVSIVGGSLGGGAAAQATIDATPGEIDRIVLLAHMSIDTPEKMRGRKLFIVARNDRDGNDRPRLDGIRQQYEQAPGPKELVVLEGSAHAQFVFQTDQARPLMREIVRFLSAP
jgi:dienelactone hydrolase